ncbi:MAG: ribose 5-phosphate isomerase B [Chloroflexi bacterium]|nr:ribose 5-phosphate isomerase B [Chloroflexota bacterium]
MKIVIAADHAGFDLKESLKGYISQLGYEVVDLGTHSTDAVDYPDVAQSLGEAIVAGQGERGVLICGSGVGANVAANKIPGIRAAICHDTYSAAQGVEHDDMNVLTLGGRVIGVEVGKSLVEAFLSAEFSGDERHLRRLNKIKAIEASYTGSKQDG